MLEPKYKEKYLEKIKENFKNFDINDEGVQLKIKNFCLKFGFDENEVFNKIKNDNFLKAWFIKDPSKQNIYEKTFYSFLQNIKIIKNLKKLPNSGKNSLFIINQEVRIRKDSSNSITKQAKSMDFSFIFNNINFYVFHKYTNESGGAQDNQKNDVINAIEKAKSAYINEKIFVLFVCDGDYYKNNNWVEINNHITNKNFKLLKSGQIEKFLTDML